MIWPKASAKLKVKPWVQNNVNLFAYMARENPAVFFSTILGVAISIPTAYFLLKGLKAEPKGIAHQKVFYTVFRPEDYPQELHKHCR